MGYDLMEFHCQVKVASYVDEIAIVSAITYLKEFILMWSGSFCQFHLFVSVV